MNYADWKREIYRLDGGVCRNKRCRDMLPIPSLYDSGIQPHHIIYLSQGGKDTAENVVSLCRKCHKVVHEGVLIDNVRITGREFMLFILEQWVGHKDFRWQEAYTELKKKPRRKG